MEQEIIVSDLYLGILLRNVLLENNNRNPKYGDMNYKNFTLAELATITKLKLVGNPFEDISVLAFCVNLKDLEIQSQNAKKVDSTLTDTAEFNYEMKKSKIKDFSVISKLKKLEYLTISYEDNLTSLDVSNLENLTCLDLHQNPNLTKIIGLDNLKKLVELTLYRNNIHHSFNLPQLLQNDLSYIKLDFDMYPILKQQYFCLDDILLEETKNGRNCFWVENISNFKTNIISATRMKKMHDKVVEILKDIIRPHYNDVQKVLAIYQYIIMNVKYDDELLEASKKDKTTLSDDKKVVVSGEKLETIYNRMQSSYNAILEGKSVCEGYTNMMHYLLACVGIDSKTVSCSADISSLVVGANSNHSVIRVNIGNDWYYFDPTFDANTGRVNNCFKTKTEFSNNHVLSLTEKVIKSPTKKVCTIDNNNELLYALLPDIINKKIVNKEKEPSLLDVSFAKMDILRQQYGIVVMEIEKLMVDGKNVENCEDKLRKLIKLRDELNEQLSLESISLKTFQLHNDYDSFEEQTKIISSVEKLLDIVIDVVSKYEIMDNGVPKAVLKPISRLIEERGTIFKLIDEKFYQGKIDLKTKRKMQEAITYQYDKMIDAAYSTVETKKEDLSLASEDKVTKGK